MRIDYLNFDGQERAYSQAVRVGGFVFAAAALGDAGDAIEVQAAKTFDYLARTLEQAGTSLDRVVKATVYLVNMDEWERYNEVWKRYFPANKPARATVEVSRLRGPVRIEIDLIAALPDG